MPRNPFHSLREIVGSRPVNPEMAIRALMATVFTDCCHDCNERLRNAEFLQAFEHMLDEMLHVERISKVA